MDRQPFTQRIDSLIRDVGIGHLKAGCLVNQPYAQEIHQDTKLRHRVGRSHYLGGPLLENAYKLMEELAHRVITPDGSEIEQGMISVAEHMARFVRENSPKQTGTLSLSGNPWVESDGRRVYDRPAIAPRRQDKN